MSTVNIWGFSDSASQSPTQAVSLNNYVRKSGDTMSGSINMDGNRVANLGVPEQDMDACTKLFVNERHTFTKAYVDRANASAIHKGGDEGTGALKIGTKNNQNVELIKNNAIFLTLDDSIKLNKELNLQNNKIYNLPLPTQNGEAANKNYVDDIKTEMRAYADRLNSTAVHRLGDTGVVGALFLGSNDNCPVLLVCNRQRYISLFQDSISILRDLDLNNLKIVNVRDPTDALDGCNKRYVDSKVMTRNHSGYIPINPELYRFIIRTSVPVVDNNILGNIFNDDVNSVWEILNENRPTRFLISCPEEVVVWSIVMSFQNSNVRGLNVNIYGGGDTNFTNITANIVRTINNSTYTTLGEEKNKNKFRGYTIEINPGDLVAESLKLIRFQMFVYND